MTFEKRTKCGEGEILMIISAKSASHCRNKYEGPEAVLPLECLRIIIRGETRLADRKVTVNKVRAVARGQLLLGLVTHWFYSQWYGKLL